MVWALLGNNENPNLFYYYRLINLHYFLDISTFTIINLILVTAILRRLKSTFCCKMDEIEKIMPLYYSNYMVVIIIKWAYFFNLTTFDLLHRLSSL